MPVDYDKPLSMPRIVMTLLAMWAAALGWSAYELYPVRSPEAYEQARAYSEHELATREYIKRRRRERLEHIAHAGYDRARLHAYAWTVGLVPLSSLAMIWGTRRQRRLRREALTRASETRTS